ncbi:MAG: hypothetical protein P8X70_01450 [Nanoarchaeota archaeon]
MVEGGYEQFSVSASCSEGKKLLGGGCFDKEVYFSYPYSDTTWNCWFTEGYGVAYAICADVED